MLIPIHPGCGGIIGLNLDGLCSHCGKHPHRVMQFDDPTLPCRTCGRDYRRGHKQTCKAAARRMNAGRAVLIQSILDPDGTQPPALACFVPLERES